MFIEPDIKCCICCIECQYRFGKWKKKTMKHNWSKSCCTLLIIALQYCWNVEQQTHTRGCDFCMESAPFINTGLNLQTIFSHFIPYNTEILTITQTACLWARQTHTRTTRPAEQTYRRGITMYGIYIQKIHAYFICSWTDDVL